MHIRVLIAEASPFRANVLYRALQSSARTTPVGIARDGEEAVLLAHRLKPDVIILDVSLPALRGHLAARQILDHVPARILITAEPHSPEENRMAFVALDEGAIDVMARPATVLEEGPPGFARSVAKRVEAVSRARIWTPLHQRTTPSGKNGAVASNPLLVVAGGIGGIQAGTHVMRSLSGAFRGSVLMMQTIEEGFLDGYARWLHKETRFRVEVCRRAMLLKPHTIYLAPESAHLVLKSKTTAAPFRGKPIRGRRPSFTALCRSAAEHRREGVVALVLSGEGQDGIEGLKLVRKAGGVVVGQGVRSCLIAELVEQAKKLGIVDETLALDDPIQLLSVIASVDRKSRSA